MNTTDSFDSKPKMRFPSKRVALIAVALVLLVGGAYLYRRRSTTPDEFKIKDAPTQTLNDNLTKQNYDAARAQIKSSKDMDAKQRQLALASISLNAKDYDRAEKEYAQYVKDFGLDAEVAVRLAQVYELKGDKKQAIEYYEKAIDLYKKQGTSSAKAQAQLYQDAITRLKQ